MKEGKPLTIEKITMPQLGESVTEGTISKWLVSPGDKINKYDPLAEVMTDKVNAEIPSSFTGIVKELIAVEGDTLAINEVICTIEVASEQNDTHVTEKNNQKEITEQSVLLPETNDATKLRYSPAVLKLSQEHGLDLSQITGTGAGGRITRKDVLAIIESGTMPQQQTKETQQEQEIPVVSQSEPSAKLATETQVVDQQVTTAGDIELPVTGIRKAIATNMLRSKHEIPHAWTMIEVDVTQLVRFRNKVKDKFKQTEGYSLTFFAFFVKAVAQALKEFPQMNAMWAGDKIIQKKDINISIAVATDDALFVPVIKHADEKTIKGIAREISELAQKVRIGKLVANDMQGGTFTVNNTGSFGSVQSMGIINYPQAAILQVESIVKRPVVIDDMIAVRDMVNLCLSLDHRVLDGLVAGHFLQRVKAILENISQETTSIY